MNISLRAKQAGRMHWVILIGAIVVVILAVLTASVIIQEDTPATAETEQAIADEFRAALASEHSPTLGDPNARVHVVEFLDPACETCAMFYPMVKQWMSEVPGKMRLSIRHVPFHRGSDYAVRVLEASREQGKYWETLEALLSTQREWTQNHTVLQDRILPAIADVGLDMDKLADDMNRMDVLVRMERDQEDAKTVQVRATPEYYVNGRPLPSFGREQLATLVREELARAYPR
jgi:protein-disulfide isomerase